MRTQESKESSYFSFHRLICFNESFFFKLIVFPSTPAFPLNEHLAECSEWSFSRTLAAVEMMTDIPPNTTYHTL